MIDLEQAKRNVTHLGTVNVLVRAEDWSALLQEIMQLRLDLAAAQRAADGLRDELSRARQSRAWQLGDPTPPTC